MCAVSMQGMREKHKWLEAGEGVLLSTEMHLELIKLYRCRKRLHRASNVQLLHHTWKYLVSYHQVLTVLCKGT